MRRTALTCYENIDAWHLEKMEVVTDKYRLTLASRKWSYTDKPFATLDEGIVEQMCVYGLFREAYVWRSAKYSSWGR